MTVLICYASKHGSTQGIADSLAGALQSAGIEVEVLPLNPAIDPASYAAAIVGSAVYYGHWLKPAVDFVRRNRDALAARPVWLFSTGPLGDQAPAEPHETAEFRATIAPRDHRVFAGALDRGSLSFTERAVVKGVRAPLGDFRDWDEITGWAQGIARELAHPAVA